MSLFFFGKKREVNFPIGEFLKVDIHSHILPGIDDGAKDVDISIRLLQGMRFLGFETVIGTPHVMVDIHKNDRQTIDGAFKGLTLQTTGRSDLPDIHYAAEHMMDEGFSTLVGSKEVIPYGSSSFILVETPYLLRPLNLEHLSFRLGTAGYRAILAHPERYHYLFNKPAEYEKLKESGFQFQVNALSLIGYYGSAEKTAATWLLESGLIDYVATDLHHERHLNNFSAYRLPQKTIALLERSTFRNREIAQAYETSKPDQGVKK